MKIAYVKEAIKQLDKLRLSDFQTWKRVSQKIIGIAEGTVQREKLQGLQGHYKTRVGKYRIIYTIEDDVLVIIVTVMKRGKIYKKTS